MQPALTGVAGAAGATTDWWLKALWTEETEAWPAEAAPQGDSDQYTQTPLVHSSKVLTPQDFLADT